METSLAGLVFSFSSDESARNGFPGGEERARRLLAGHYVPPQLPAATARRTLCTTPTACGDCSTGIIPTPIARGDCSTGLCSAPTACGDCSTGIMYHPYCPRRLLAGHYVPPQLPAATARQALCTTPIARSDCSPGIMPPFYLRRLLAADFQPTVSSSESDILF